MPLTRVERERINDSRMKIQAVAHTLRQLDPEKVPGWDKIQECLHETEESFHGALHSSDGDGK